jgi:hypothetical protein
MSLPKLPTLLLNQPARLFLTQSVIPLRTAECDVLELPVGQALRFESQKRNCTENNERSLNVIENTRSVNGISWNVIDNTGS